MPGYFTRKASNLMQQFHLFRRFRLAMVLLASTLSVVTMYHAAPSRAAALSGTTLSVYFGYAEDKETNTPVPGTFPSPWAGAPNVAFLGGPVVGQTACGALPQCYDAGAIRLDNPGPSAVTVSNVTVDMHSAIPGGKVFSLWGSFTVPAGQSVILTEDPPGNNPGYDNFDTSGYPANNCTPVTVQPTVKLTINGVVSTIVDSHHVLDTGGIDVGYCKPKRNESIQWQAAGTLDVNAPIPPPPGWNGADIGNPPLPGSDSYANGVWTVAGSGRDIGGTADQFHLAWQTLPGDGGISARVVTEANTNSRARAGVMLRQSTDPGAPFYAMLVTPQRGIFVLRRATQGGGVSTVASLPGTTPIFVQVSRSGNTYTAAMSNDGVTWTVVPGSSSTMTMPGAVLAGLAVTSHTLTQVNTATFDQVALH